ncbi:cyclic nucleotide-binding domain-containing protein, partial [Elusimicrobiota bacterium]
MPHDDTIFLKGSVDVLSFFNEEQLRRVTPDIERATYKKGDLLMFKGEITSGFYIIKQGKVRVSTKEKNYDLARGDFFGEMSVLEDTAATESVRASEDDTEIIT